MNKQCELRWSCSSPPALALAAGQHVGAQPSIHGGDDAGAAGGDGGVDAGYDAYAALDPPPFGHHPAIASGVDFPADPYAPAKAAGVAWTRDGDAPYLFWSFVDPTYSGDPAQMRFSGVVAPGPMGGSTVEYDRAISGALASGLQVLWNIDVGEEPGARKPGSWLPVDEAAYSRFVETAVKRYPGIRIWQVGNEPQLARRTDYAKFHRITAEAIRRADPTAMVMLAGLAGNMTTGADFKDTSFDAVLDELGGCCVDVFDFHFYGDPVGGTLLPPGGASGNERFLGYGDLEEVASFYRARLDARGYAKTRIWTTENGTPGEVAGGPAPMMATEANGRTCQRTVAALGAGVDKLFWAFGMTGFGPAGRRLLRRGSSASPGLAARGS